MPFSRMQQAEILAARVETAVNRRDEIGMDMLRNLLPELREMIDDVNAALQEVDELLFTGLRDEAITLNDPEFVKVAARLNLEDKGAWPDVQAFFEREGITPPPKLDFEALAALESAHAELEQLGRPLDKMRRLVLERAPLLQRLAILRRLRDADGTKPVWAETITEHERARLAELPELVNRALAARDSALLAALHAELVDPEWTVSVPKDLVKATRGAELWDRLREAVPLAEQAAAALETGFADARAGVDPVAVSSLRQHRAAWDEASAIVHESLAGVGNCPNVAAFIRHEGLEDRFRASGDRVRPALDWLAEVDRRETEFAGQQQALAHLDSLVTMLPATAGDERQWLADVTTLERQLAAAGVTLPEDLGHRVSTAVRDVRRRPIVRLALKAGLALAGIVAVFTMIGTVRGCVSMRQDYEEDVATLTTLLEEARAGDHAEPPPRVAAIRGRHGDDGQVERLCDGITAAIETEATRRQNVRQALADHARLSTEAIAELERRKRENASLDGWPECVIAAATAWQAARSTGGLPSNRGEPQVRATGTGSRPAMVHEEEERLIGIARDGQRALETKYQNAANQMFRKRCVEIEQNLEAARAAPSPEMCREIRDALAALQFAAGEPRAAAPNLLLSGTVATRIPASLEADLAPLTRRLADLERLVAQRPSTGREDLP